MKPNTHIPVKTDPSSFDGQEFLVDSQRRSARDICLSKKMSLTPFPLQTSKALCKTYENASLEKVKNALELLLNQRPALNLKTKFNNKPNKPMYNLKTHLSLTNILTLLVILLGLQGFPQYRYYPGTET